MSKFIRNVSLTTMLCIVCAFSLQAQDCRNSYGKYWSNRSSCGEHTAWSNSRHQDCCAQEKSCQQRDFPQCNHGAKQDCRSKQNCDARQDCGVKQNCDRGKSACGQRGAQSRCGQEQEGKRVVKVTVRSRCEVEQDDEEGEVQETEAPQCGAKYRLNKIRIQELETSCCIPRGYSRELNRRNDQCMQGHKSCGSGAGSHKCDTGSLERMESDLNGLQEKCQMRHQSCDAK